jgi:hypothetical protein
MKRFNQKRVQGGRQALGSCVLKEIRAEVTRLAREHRVSKSFVVATVLADAFKIKKQERYYEIDRTPNLHGFRKKQKR